MKSHSAENALLRGVFFLFSVFFLVTFFLIWLIEPVERSGSGFEHGRWCHRYVKLGEILRKEEEGEEGNDGIRCRDTERVMSIYF